jgi:hypothetical protein
MTTAHAGWWRRERTVQPPTSNGWGSRGAVATEVLWSNWPLPPPGRLLEPGAVGCP